MSEPAIDPCIFHRTEYLSRKTRLWKDLEDGLVIGIRRKSFAALRDLVLLRLVTDRQQARAGLAKNAGGAGIVLYPGPPRNVTAILELIQRHQPTILPGDDRALVLGPILRRVDHIAQRHAHTRAIRSRVALQAAVDAALKSAETAGAQGQLGDQARRSAFRTLYDMHNISPCAIENVRPVEAYAAETRDEALRTAGALRVIVNSLSGVPGHRALLFVSDGISVTPGEELFQALAELCGGSTEPNDLSSGNSNKEARGGDGGAKYDPRQAPLDAQKYSVAKRFEDLAAHASANRVTLYTLQASGLRGFAAGGAELDPGERRLLSSSVQMIQTTNLRGTLSALAVDTGGRAMFDANDLGPELGRMQEDFESYYSLGYSPAHHGDGRQHKVDVKLKRPGLRVRYRPSYRDKPAMEKAVDRTLTALLHGIEDNPLEVALELGPQTREAASNTWAVPIQLKIPLYKLAIIPKDGGDSYQGRLRLLVATRDGKGGTSSVRQVEVPLEISRKEVLNALGQHYLYTLTLKMPAGEQRVAVAVRDELSATTSYLSRAVTVSAATAAAVGK